VEGVSLAWRSWGNPGRTGLVLVHGAQAHARWWDHIAPSMSGDRQVIALDLSGHGDSGRRPRYDLDLWADEVVQVAAENFEAPPVVVGHSMGGTVALRAGTRFADRIAGVVAIDSTVRQLTPEEHQARERRILGPLRIYPTKAAAIANFRPTPEQPVLPYVRDHIAETSVRPAAGGWCWKFDPQVAARQVFTPDMVTRLDCPVGIFTAERGLVSAEMKELIRGRLDQPVPMIEVPTAGHHVMLDQPIALITGLRALLSAWESKDAI
jgi:pimeloyl-ACP methyl ester carboxylesterase